MSLGDDRILARRASSKLLIKRVCVVELSSLGALRQVLDLKSRKKCVRDQLALPTRHGNLPINGAELVED